MDVQQCTKRGVANLGLKNAATVHTRDPTVISITTMTTRRRFNIDYVRIY